MLDNKELKLKELANRVKEIMSDEDIVVKEVIPKHKTDTFTGKSPYEIARKVEVTCGWEPWGYYELVDLSYTSHVAQNPVVDTWTNRTEYSALAIFRKHSFKPEAVSELRSIYTEARRLLGLGIDADYYECTQLVRAALGVGD